MPDAYRILYICEHGSLRSPLAAALTNKISQGKVVASAAGVHPRPIEAQVTNLLVELGASSNLTQSVSVNELDLSEFDEVITLCDRSAEAAQMAVCTTSCWDEPANAQDDENCLKTVEIELAERIRLMLIAKHFIR